MSIKNEISDKVDLALKEFSNHPIGKGLIAGGLSCLPVLGPAIMEVLNSRLSQTMFRNTENFVDELKRQLEDVNEKAISKGFLGSDEFSSLLLEILTKNARTHEREKISYYATIFINSTMEDKSEVPYKEGFVRIVDELSVQHILILSYILSRSLAFSDEDKKNNRDFINSTEIAETQRISESRAKAYCEQMIRYGLLQDWYIGRWDYKPGHYALAEYGFEFTAFLRSESKHV
jgi:hypothetical protein